jgi:hypothetical protein
LRRIRAWKQWKLMLHIQCRFSSVRFLFISMCPPLGLPSPSPVTDFHERHATLRSSHPSILCISYGVNGSRDSVVGIATDCGLDDRGVGVLVGSRISSSLHRPDRLWGLPLGVPGALSPGVKRQCVKLNTHIQLVRSQENVDPYIHSPIRLHGIVLN